MTKRKKNIILAIGFVQLFLIIGIVNLPYILENFVPGQYRAMLPSFINDTLGVRDNYLPQVGNEPISEIAAIDLVGGLNLANEDESNKQDSNSVILIESPAATSNIRPTIDLTATLAPTQAIASPTPTATSTPLPSPTPLPVNIKLSGLVNEPQKFNNCGPTNLAIMLRYYGDDTTQTEAANYLKPNREDRNVSPWQISDYVNEFTNLRSITRSNGNQELLRELVASGFPVVVEKGYDPEAADAFGWYGHYLTVFGYDSLKEEYNTIDTFLGPFTDKDIQKEGYTLEDGFIYSYDYMAKYWQQFNYTFYVVYQIEREEELYQILGDEFVYTEDNWKAAALRAQADVEMNPENPFAWFNLGSSLTELGKKTTNNHHH